MNTKADRGHAAARYAAAPRFPTFGEPPCVAPQRARAALSGSIALVLFATMMATPVRADTAVSDGRIARQDPAVMAPGDEHDEVRVASAEAAALEYNWTPTIVGAAVGGVVALGQAGALAASAGFFGLFFVQGSGVFPVEAALSMILFAVAAPFGLAGLFVGPIVYLTRVFTSERASPWLLAGSLAAIVPAALALVLYVLVPYPSFALSGDNRGFAVGAGVLAASATAAMAVPVVAIAGDALSVLAVEAAAQE